MHGASHDTLTVLVIEHSVLEDENAKVSTEADAKDSLLVHAMP